jgi:hypothetical protein
VSDGPSADRLLAAAKLSLTVALRNVKALETSEDPMKGPEFSFVAINLQNATHQLRAWSDAYQAEHGGSPIA